MKSSMGNSGIEEVIAPSYQLLNEFLLQIGEEQESRRRERGEATESKEPIVTTGEQIQRNKISRRLLVRDEDTRCQRERIRTRPFKFDIGESEDAMERKLEHQRKARKYDLNFRGQELDLSRW